MADISREMKEMKGFFERNVSALLTESTKHFPIAVFWDDLVQPTKTPFGSQLNKLDHSRHHSPSKFRSRKWVVAAARLFSFLRKLRTARETSLLYLQLSGSLFANWRYLGFRQMAAEIAILLTRSFSFFDLRQQRKNYRKKKKLEVKGKSVESTWLIRNWIIRSICGCRSKISVNVEYTPTFARFLHGTIILIFFGIFWTVAVKN